MNGRTRLFNVFPMPEQATDPETMDPVGEARLQTPPFASLPPVTLPGVQPSVLVPPQTAAQKAAAARKRRRRMRRRRPRRARRR